MTIRLLAVYIVILHTACTRLESVAPLQTPPVSLIAYDSFLNKLNSQDITSIDEAKTKYIEIFQTEKADTKDQAFLLFLDYYDQMNSSLNYSIENEEQNQDPFILKDQIRNYQANGFELGFSEGVYFIKQNKAYIANHFYTHVSSVLKKYLEQLYKESNEGFLEDASIVITPEQFSDRLAWWDSFIEDNPNFILLHEAKENRKRLLTLFLTGIDNTPLLDDRNRLTTYYESAYEVIKKRFPNTTTTKLLGLYFSALEKGDVNTAMFLVKDLRMRGIIQSD
jgi:hypothetical protein